MYKKCGSYPRIGLEIAFGILEVKAPRICRQLAHKGKKLVSRKHRPPLPRRGYPSYSSLLDDESSPGQYGGRKDLSK